MSLNPSAPFDAVGVADGSFVSPLICGLFKTPSQILKLIRCPHSLAPTLVILPSMSLIPQLHSPVASVI
jgi:hypothetical protein